MLADDETTLELGIDELDKGSKALWKRYTLGTRLGQGASHMQPPQLTPLLLPRFPLQVQEA